MEIRFDKVMPEPLSTMVHNEESIWGASFTLSKGQKVMLNASSGKGKTTFTHLIAGIRKDFAGDIFFSDKRIKTLSPDEYAKIRKAKIAFIFQDLQLFPALTVKENLLLKNQLTTTFSESEIKAFINQLEIGDKWDTPCKLLSMGQQQRVAIVRAICQPFDWLIMDEPFSHLDKENMNKCLDLIQKRCEELSAGFVITSLGEDHGVKFDKILKL